MCINRCINTEEASIERDAAKIKKRLNRDGWIGKEGARHTLYRHPEKPGRVTVPRHRGDLPIGTAKDIAKEAGWE